MENLFGCGAPLWTDQSLEDPNRLQVDHSDEIGPWPESDGRGFSIDEIGLSTFPNSKSTLAEIWRQVKSELRRIQRIYGPLTGQRQDCGDASVASLEEAGECYLPTLSGSCIE
jgi:hypothetical protein